MIEEIEKIQAEDIELPTLTKVSGYIETQGNQIMNAEIFRDKLQDKINTLDYEINFTVQHDPTAIAQLQTIIETLETVRDIVIDIIKTT